jgi:hypothetical protein
MTNRLNLNKEYLVMFWQRIVRAAKLDSSLYEEVEKDNQALPQAMAVVLLSAVAAGIGSISKIGISGIFIGALIGLVAWYIWAMLTYLIGTKLLPEKETKADLGELLRTIGFSSSPGIIRVLGVIVVAVKCALDYKSIWRAVGVCLIGWVAQVLILTFLFAISGGLKSL